MRRDPAADVGLVGAPEAVMSAETTGAVGRIMRGGALALLAHASGAVATFAVSIAIGRVLGPGALGRYTFHVWLLTAIPAIAALGLPAALTRVAAEGIGGGDVATARGLWRLTLRIHAGVLLVVAVVVGLLMLRPGTDRWLLLALMAGIAGALLALDFEGLFSAFRRYGLLTWLAILGAVGLIAQVLVALAIGFGWRGVVVTYSVWLCGGILVYVPLLRRTFAGVPLRHPDAEQRRTLYRFAGIAVVTALLGQILWGRPELFFLEQFHSDREVGLYSAALRLASLAAIVPFVAARVLVPEFSALRGSRHHVELAEAYTRSCFLLACVTAPAAFGSAAVAEFALPAVFGEAFVDARLAAIVLGVGAIVGAIAGPTSAAILVGPKPRATVVIGVVAMVVDLGLAVALIPAFGPSGAAWASVIAQAVMVVASAAYVWRALSLHYPIVPVLRVAALALGSALVAGLVGRHAPGGDGVALAASVVLGAAAYVVGMTLTRTLRWRDVQMMLAR